jgi:hypothetical protein
MKSNIIFTTQSRLHFVQGKKLKFSLFLINQALRYEDVGTVEVQLHNS